MQQQSDLVPLPVDMVLQHLVRVRLQIIFIALPWGIKALQVVLVPMQWGITPLRVEILLWQWAHIRGPAVTIQPH